MSSGRHMRLNHELYGNDAEKQDLTAETESTLPRSEENGLCQIIRRNWISIVFFTPVLLLTIPGLIWALKPTHCNNLTHSQHQHILSPTTLDSTGRPLNACYCGHNTTEALSLNCTFDPISPSWQPPHCHSPELSHRLTSAASVYNPSGRWHYYKTPSRDTEYTVEGFANLANYWQDPDGDVAAGAYISWEWHILHCLLLYEKAMKARQGLVVLEAKYETVGHAEHCTKMFLHPKETFTVVALDGEVQN